ncbi:MAG: NADH-quinone oxidoreductase subunit C [Anaerolineae bacterium]|uniref:NADH-quinone oxidoreductase subunit C n=1 Tax=Promineifilum sp. TaxID=2664178 RepID=UPI001DAE6C0E|nr:NADH-quinone oxidoreductase subunit C [Anaerolineales bacterium]MCB8936741.1 NADH-quinone oxidoreductase subunit C [Promineifilum sp.]MCO5181338.1 NADH-quinone oxidoreductase subunit C [Promineifilum sp.]MCW5848317.1 NADH-quinone oxidoreductase subunit C [Anaerolineae bacterium]
MTRDDMATDKLRAALGEAVEDVGDFRGERTIYIRRDKIVDACRLLRDDPELRYNLLSDIVADDYLPDYPRFAVSYHLLSMHHKHRLRLRVRVEDPDEGPPTMADVWPIATWLEMEVWDLMGVRFAGNGSLRRLFLPEDWQGHPLRKDYPLGYEEVQFSFNWEEINAKKPFAKE